MPRLSKTLQEQNHTVRDPTPLPKPTSFPVGKVLVEDKCQGKGFLFKTGCAQPKPNLQCLCSSCETKPLGEQPCSECGSPPKQVPWKERPLHTLPQGRGATPPPASQAHGDSEHITSLNHRRYARKATQDLPPQSTQSCPKRPPEALNTHRAGRRAARSCTQTRKAPPSPALGSGGKSGRAAH